MAAVAAPIVQATPNLAPTIHKEVAQGLGYPAILFGLTPNDPDYWREPNLPWLTPELWENRPLGYNGYKIIWNLCEFGGNDMAPRFPKGTVVNMVPVFEKKNLVVGRVYAHRNAKTGEQEYQVARLEEIGANYLIALPDNGARPCLWPLHRDESRVVWDVYGITHYLSYPIEYPALS